MRALITGASGFVGSQLGQRMSRDHEILGITFRSSRPLPFPTQRVDLTDERTVAFVVREFRPDVIVHSAALSRVLACQTEPALAEAVNVAATGRLARWAERLHAKLIFLSSDQVFAGDKGLYIESDLPKPINVYGRTKLSAEREVLETSSANLVIRSNSVVGPSQGGGESFSDWVLNRVQSGMRVPLFQDQYRSPLHVRTLLDVLVSACIHDVTGLIHVGGPKRMSRRELGYAVIRAYGLTPDLVDETELRSHPHAEIMPRDTSYRIAHLKQAMPYITFEALEDEFLKDARQAEVKA